jgi:hypothetical protein
MNALERGQTYYGPDGTIDASTDYGGVELEGVDVIFKHTDTTDPTIIESARLVKGRIMRNVSGVTLYGGLMVVHKTAYRGRRFSARSRITAEEVAGVIDPRLYTTGVRDGDLCIVFTKGPCDVYVAASVAADIVAADLAYAITATTAQCTAAHSGAYTSEDAGKVEAIGATSGKTLYETNYVGRFETTALSTTVDNTMVLVDLCIE